MRQNKLPYNFFFWVWCKKKLVHFCDLWAWSNVDKYFFQKLLLFLSLLWSLRTTLSDMWSSLCVSKRSSYNFIYQSLQKCWFILWFFNVSSTCDHIHSFLLPHRLHGYKWGQFIEIPWHFIKNVTKLFLMLQTGSHFIQ